mgnify:FL=1
MIIRNVENKENKTAEVKVEIDSAEFESAVNAAYKKNKNSISIPGFRKGKAPRAVIEGMYGPEVFYQDAIDDLCPQAYGYAVDNAELRIIGTPSITDVDLAEDKTLSITFSLELYPQVTLGEYKNLSAPKMSAEVTDDDVMKQIRNTAKRNARMLSVDREAQMGDTANIDFDGYLDGERFDGGKAEGFDLELGSGSFVPGFEEQVVGMNIGEEKDIDITFPEDYVENLAGKAVVFKVKLNSLTTPELPELDDDFAQDVSEFDTFDEYKADVRSSMEKAKSDEADAKFRTEIMTQACDNLVVDVPETMIDMKLNEILRNYAANFGVTGDDVKTEDLMKLMGLDKDTVDATLRPAAVYQVKQELLLEAVAAAENIEVTDEDTDEYIKGAAETVNAKPEDILNYFGMDFIRNEFKKEKATKIIIESASVSEGEAE